MASQLDPRLKFLNDAAHLLNADSPSTAAFLQSRIESLTTQSLDMEDGPLIALTTQQLNTLEAIRSPRYTICKACGFMSNRGYTWTNDAGSSERRSSDIGADHFRCQLCGAKSERTTSQPARTSAGTIGKPQTRSLNSEDLGSSRGDPEITQDSGAGSKRKNKRQVHQTRSVSSLIAASKQYSTPASVSTNFDLMDFMKSS